MLAGIGRTESKIPRGSAAAPPATINTTIVSPIARLVFCRPEGVGCLLEIARNRMERVFGNARDRRDRHDGKHQRRVNDIKPGRDIERLLHPRRQDHHPEETEHNRGEPCQEFDDGL